MQSISGAATIEVAKVPISDGAKAALAAEPSLIESVLAGGDDYEILCTVTPDRAQSFRAAAAALKVPLTEIGGISQGEGARFLGADMQPMHLSRLSYSHF